MEVMGVMGSLRAVVLYAGDLILMAENDENLCGRIVKWKINNITFNGR